MFNEGEDIFLIITRQGLKINQIYLASRKVSFATLMNDEALASFDLNGRQALLEACPNSLPHQNVIWGGGANI